MANRIINEIIVHCTATPAGRDVSVDDIRRWHTRERGWRDIGYHWVVLPDGTVQPGRPMEQEGAHCKGHNRHSVGVCYVGGIGAKGKPADTRTPRQRAALERLIAQLLERYPGSSVHSHSDYAAKACPCFDATGEYWHLWHQ